MPQWERIQGLFDDASFLNARVLRFLLSGSISALTNFSILYALTEYVQLWYLFSSIVAFSVSLVVSFVLQKFWTFRNHSLERVHIQAPLHVGLAITDLLLNTLALYVMVEWFGLWYMFAQFIAAGGIACINYYVYKTHIFT